MRKLLRAGFSRLWKDKGFWLCMAGFFGLSLLVMENLIREVDPAEYTMDELFFGGLPYIAILSAIVNSLFIGEDYADGTIRNKVVVGHSRMDIYLSNLVICFVANLALLAVWCVGSLIGVPKFGFFQQPPEELAMLVLNLVLMIAAFDAIFTLLAMVGFGREATAVVAILLSLAMIVGGSWCENRLAQQETVTQGVMAEDGSLQWEEVQNPNYVTGTKREILQWISDGMPSSQSMQISNNGKLTNPVRSACLSVVLVTVTTLAGCAVFEKKDLK